MDRLQGSWERTTPVAAVTFQCGYCGATVAPSTGYKATQQARSVICPSCNRPTFLNGREEQVPGPLLGGTIADVPSDINALYRDAQRSSSSTAYTSCVLTLRKILMHVAVEKDAKPKASFLNHIKHLADAGYLPPGADGWVDYIRRRANEANHEIQLMTAEDATVLLKFTEALLRHVYELPGLVPTPPASDDDPVAPSETP